MRHDIATNCTVYIVASNPADPCVVALKACLKVLPQDRKTHVPNAVRLDLSEPFEIHLVLTQLSFELSKKHVTFFQRKMRGPVSSVV